MSLDQRDIEIIEGLIYKNADDVAVSISRSFERLEERVDAMEIRLGRRIAELEDRLESTRQDLSDSIGNIKEEMRDIFRMWDEVGTLG